MELILENDLLNNGESIFPTSIFENLLQNADLLEALFKPMSNTNDNTNTTTTTTTSSSTTTAVTEQQQFDLPFDPTLLLEAKKIEEAEDTSKIYGNAFLGPNLWNKDELFASDKFSFQLELLETEDFIAESGFNTAEFQFLSEPLQDNQTNDQNNNNNNNNYSSNDPVVSEPTVSSEPNLVVCNEVEITNNDIPVITVQTEENLTEMLIEPNFETKSQPKTTKTKKSTTKPVVINNTETSSSESIDFLEEDLKLLSTDQNSDNNFDTSTIDDDSNDYFDDEPSNSKKRKIPDEQKDEKYWNRRRQNNLAAKRSRDARRLKESEVALRATFLENENTLLKRQLDEYKQETKLLKMKLARYERKKNH